MTTEESICVTLVILDETERNEESSECEIILDPSLSLRMTHYCHSEEEYSDDAESSHLEWHQLDEIKKLSTFVESLFCLSI